MTVFAPMVDSHSNGDWSFGKAELTRQYYDGLNIAIDCKAYASRYILPRRTAYSRFAHALTGRPTIQRDHPWDPENKRVIPHEIGHERTPYSHSDSLVHYNIGPINRLYKSQAYVRTVISGGDEDDFFINNTEDFTPMDEPFNAHDPN